MSQEIRSGVFASLVVITVTWLSGCKGIDIAVPQPQPVPTVDVAGNVQTPQSMPIPKDGLRLWQAILRAGGIADKSLAPNVQPDLRKYAVNLSRRNQKFFIALPIVQGQAAGEIQLLAGDIVTVIPVEQVSLLRRGNVSDSMRQAGLRSLAELEGSSVHRSGPGAIFDRIPQSAATSTPPLATVSDTLADGTPLGDCETDSVLPSPVAGVSPGVSPGADTAVTAPRPITAGLNSRNGLVSIVLRKSEIPAGITEMYIFPTRNWGERFGSGLFDARILDHLYPLPGDQVGFLNVEQIPVVASSLIAPQIKATLDQARIAQLQYQQQHRDDPCGSNLFLIGPLVRSLSQHMRQSATVHVKPYQAPPIEIPQLSGRPTTP